MGGLLPQILSFYLLMFICCGNGSYIITAPREWLPGSDLQVCAQVTSPEAPPGNITLTITLRQTFLNSRSKRDIILPPISPPSLSDGEFLPPVTIEIPAGELLKCEGIPTPKLSTEEEKFLQHYFSVSGYIDGVDVAHSHRIHKQTLQTNTIIQTDKYLYQPGQVVQFRILTHSGPLLNISTDSYAEVYVTNPSKTRIAQWLNVNNAGGLVHLSMPLAEEPEEGSYTIHVTNKETTETTQFKVEEYVLPRFEVTLEPPNFVLASDDSFSVSACAKYTFGQPLKGNITWRISNSRRRTCGVDVIKDSKISGCSTITVQTSELRIADCNTPSINFTVTVTEEGTGVEATRSHLVDVTKKAFTLNKIQMDNYMKPNLPFTLKLRADLPDGSPAVGEVLEACHGNACKRYTTSQDGTVSIYATNRTNKRLVVENLFTRARMQSSSYSTEIKPFFSPSNSSLLIHAPEEVLRCSANQYTDYNLQVLFAAVNQPSATINVQVMSRGQVQYWKSQVYPFRSSVLPFEKEFLLEPLIPSSGNVVTGTLNIPLRLPPNVYQKAKVLIWYVRDQDGEVVSDTRELAVEKCLANNVGLSWSKNLTHPGDQANLALTAEPNSLCSLGVVDKSVELLGSKDDSISLDSLFKKLQGYHLQTSRNPQVNDETYCRRKELNSASLMIRPEFGHGHYSYYSDYVDTLKMFDESGLSVFTNLELETRPCEKEDVIYHSIFDIVADVAPININRPRLPSVNSVAVAAAEEAEPTERTDSSSPRTDFPETWLWDLVVMPSSGVSNRQVELPDTITEWVGRAVCVHPQKSLGVSERASITTFTPFFLDLTLPPAIKRGEILPVKISVFNYLQQHLPVTVTLESSPEYDILEAPNPGQQSVPGQRGSCMAPQDKTVHTVKIRPHVIGQVNITVSAYVSHQDQVVCGDGSIQKSDALVRPITVEAEGFLKEKTWSKYVCSEELSAGEESLQVTELTVPPVMVEGSERAWVTAMGDLIAISLENLGSLIRMPYGCGEQNMLNFAPNIFILQYLKATKQQTKDSTEKLLNFMNKGYQRELNYRHSDGSFSAFGKSDKSGSTWLTAFVLKSFAQAQPFIAVDESGLKETKNWLLDNYGNGTCSNSVGKIIHKDMKGGLSSGGSSAPLTSYIMISLLESGVPPSHPTVQKGFQCLDSHVSSGPYTLALKAYALALAGNSKASTLVQELLEQAVVTKNSLHWEMPKESNNALAVETAGYAILALVTVDASAYKLTAKKVVKWITTQRNGNGGFYSTQDTVVALQALALYESSLYQGALDLVAEVQAQDLVHSFQIKDSNKLLQQMVSLPTLPTNVSFSLTGQGCAMIQTVLRYNEPEADASQAFSLRVSANTEPDAQCVTKRIDVCTSYLLPDGESNMAVIEVNLVSGYIPEKEDLKKLVKENIDVIKRYEVDGNKVSFYIEEIGTDAVCVGFRIVREVDVEHVKPGSVVVYDYYQPEFTVSKTYRLPDTSHCIQA